MTHKNKTIIAPSILAADFGKLAEQIVAVEQAGAEWLHLDCMDGVFVPPITFGDNMLSLAKRTSKLYRDLHLMIVNPEKHLNFFKDAGADRITVHQEVSPHLHRTLQAIKNLGIDNGVALNPGTNVESIYDTLDICDLALIMTVNPGWGGQKFISSSLSKIEKLRNEIEKRGLKTLISVDGGINKETGAACVKAGANVLIAGTYVFKGANYKIQIDSLR